MIDIIDNTERVSRTTPKRVMITSVIDLDFISSEETPDRLHQLIKLHTKKLGIDLILFKEPSNVGKPTVSVFFYGDREKGMLMQVQDSIDLCKPRSITDLVEHSTINLVQNKILPSNHRILNLTDPKLSDLI